MAYDGAAFQSLYGFKPDFEGKDTLSDVPEVALEDNWPTWNAIHGVVSLHDASGEMVDVLPYDRGPNGDTLDKRALPKNLWSGSSVLLFHASPFGWTGQLLARDRDATVRLQPDTDSASDWDASFSANALGRSTEIGKIYFVEFFLSFSTIGDG